MMNEKQFKKAFTITDLILIIVILSLGCGFYFWQRGKSAGEKVLIKSDNELLAELPLNQDTVYIVANELGTNTIHIENGQAYMTDSDCPDKLCEQMGMISKPGETIICLPHKLIVEVSNE